MMDTRVYVVPVIDVNWLVFAPFDPGRDFRVDPPKVEQSIGETRTLCERLNSLTGGKYVLTPHSGTYCRLAYYEGELLEVYRAAVTNGAELAIHLHEEIKGAGTRFGDPEHMRQRFLACKRQYDDAGLPVSSYRGGHYAYADFMTPLLEDNGIYVDLSCAPGSNEPSREAVWVNSPLSGYYLPRDTHLVRGERQDRSKVFEIPIGSDGAGARYQNILHIEQSNLENLLRIWRAIAMRGLREGRPQIVHSLFHTGSTVCPEWLDRLERFVGLVTMNGGAFVTPSEAKGLFDHLEVNS